MRLIFMTTLLFEVFRWILVNYIKRLNDNNMCSTGVSNFGTLSGFKNYRFKDLGTVLKGTIEHGLRTQQMVNTLSLLGFEVMLNLLLFFKLLPIQTLYQIIAWFHFSWKSLVYNLYIIRCKLYRSLSELFIFFLRQSRLIENETTT